MAFNQTLGLNYSQGYAKDACEIRSCQRQEAARDSSHHKVKLGRKEKGRVVKGERRRES